MSTITKAISKHLVEQSKAYFRTNTINMNKMRQAAVPFYRYLCNIGDKDGAEELWQYFCS